jgi:hypothetical protein
VKAEVFNSEFTQGHLVPFWERETSEALNGYVASRLQSSRANLYSPN